jgi:hypothetical protein
MPVEQAQPPGPQFPHPPMPASDAVWPLSPVLTAENTDIAFLAGILHLGHSAWLVPEGCNFSNRLLHGVQVYS